MTIKNEPRNEDFLPQAELSADRSKPAETTRESTEALLAAPQLPAEFIKRIESSDRVTVDGEDIKQATLGFCEDINALLARIHGIPELAEAAMGIKEKLKNLTGETLRSQINDLLDELARLEKIITDKATNRETGADYLQNTQDGPGTPRVDLEAALLVLQKTRPLYSDITGLGLADYIAKREQEVQNRMDTRGNTQFAVRYTMQRNLEDEITEALERGEINEKTSRLILQATSGQMNLAFNVVGQRGNPIHVRLDQDDLGENEAERQFTILDVYWHLLGVVEGFKFIKKFYE